jgi:carboxylesterase
LRILLLFLLSVVVLALLLVLPYPTSATMRAQPASSYDEATRRFGAIQTAEIELALHPGCESQLLEHGAETDRVAVLFHGYRSCPLQFHRLGEQLHRSGYTVLIPRMPRMGFAPRPSDAHGRLSTDELVRYGTDAMDLAQGLGKHVTVVGFSAGGLMAAWAAQYRDDVDHAVIISPFLAPKALMDAIARPAANFFSVFPNIYLWQDAELKDAAPNPAHVYQRNATRALSALMQLGFALGRSSKERAPTAQRVAIIGNASDDVIDMDPVDELVHAWRRQGYSGIERFEFEKTLGLDHDVVDPRHPEAKTDITHPILINQILAQPN